MMRSSLKWSLVATGVASVAAVWLEPGGQGGATALIDARVTAPPSDPYGNWRNAAPSPAQDASAPVLPLPSALPDRDVEAGGRDIFTPMTPPAPPPPPPPPPAPPAPPPPPPAPPPVNWRAVGSMVTPSGERVTWLAKGSEEIAVKPGTQLDDGYAVQSIDEDKVVLLYPPLGTTARIAVPHGPSGIP